MTTTASVCSYLLAYARDHRLRTRNLNDGLPVPPARRQRVRGHRPAYVGADDRDMAIVCRLGYVHEEENVLGWALLCKSGKGLGIRLERLEKVPGVTVKQLGDTEAAGTAPVEAIDAVLDVLEPYRVRPEANLNSNLAVQGHLAPAKTRPVATPTAGDGN
jgi:hypothetical protein